MHMKQLWTTMFVSSACIAANSSCAENLYKRAIEEGNDTVAMNNLAFWLKSGGEGVTAKPSRAVHLDEQAIEEGNHTDAVYNLAILLEVGWWGCYCKPCSCFAPAWTNDHWRESCWRNEQPGIFAEIWRRESENQQVVDRSIWMVRTAVLPSDIKSSTSLLDIFQFILFFLYLIIQDYSTAAWFNPRKK